MNDLDGLDLLGAAPAKDNFEWGVALVQLGGGVAGAFAGSKLWQNHPRWGGVFGFGGGSLVMHFVAGLLFPKKGK